jgi:DMSO reductase anchor subunit
MHPAISVIFFTVTSGAGFGLMALIGFGWPVADDRLTAFLVCALAGGLAVAGLVSSTFHLGHPERAWRALSQWRSSWLSREGVLAIVTLALFSAYALYWLFFGIRSPMLGTMSALLAALTVFSTAMIYASLRTVPSWHNVLTPACYLGFSLSSGMLLASAAGQFSGVVFPSCRRASCPCGCLAGQACMVASFRWARNRPAWNRHRHCHRSGKNRQGSIARAPALW